MVENKPIDKNRQHKDISGEEKEGQQNQRSFTGGQQGGQNVRQGQQGMGGSQLGGSQQGGQKGNVGGQQGNLNKGQQGGLRREEETEEE